MSIKSGITIVSLIFIWCSVFSILTQARDAEPGTCDSKRERYNECGVLARCEPTCEKPETQPCPKICSPGCFCKKNYIRQCFNSTPCVTKKQCADEFEC